MSTIWPCQQLLGKKWPVCDILYFAISKKEKKYNEAFGSPGSQPLWTQWQSLERRAEWRASSFSDHRRQNTLERPLSLFMGWDCVVRNLLLWVTFQDSSIPLKKQLWSCCPRGLTITWSLANHIYPFIEHPAWHTVWEITGNKFLVSLYFIPIIKILS